MPDSSDQGELRTLIELVAAICEVGWFSNSVLRVNFVAISRN
jgi:hypothetical protein